MLYICTYIFAHTHKFHASLEHWMGSNAHLPGRSQSDMGNGQRVRQMRELECWLREKRATALSCTLNLPSVHDGGCCPEVLSRRSALLLVSLPEHSNRQCSWCGPRPLVRFVSCCFETVACGSLSENSSRCQSKRRAKNYRLECVYAHTNIHSCILRHTHMYVQMYFCNVLWNSAKWIPIEQLP